MSFIQDLDASPSAPLQRQERTFYASEVITVGQFLAIDTAKSLTVIPTYVKLLNLTGGGTHTNSFLFVGVALEAAAAIGDKVRVCTAGYVTGVMEGTVAVNSCLVPSTTAGGAQAAPNQNDGTAHIRKIGVALEAATDGQTKACWIYPSGF